MNMYTSNSESLMKGSAKNYTKKMDIEVYHKHKHTHTYIQ